jgi:membrane protein DedA with SNARE-associated domain
MAEGPLATLLGGAATFSGMLLPLPAYLSIVLGNLTADMGWYMLGRFSKLEWVKRLCNMFKVDPSRVEQLEKGIQANAPRLMFLAKMTVGFPIPTLIATGLSRVPVRRWVGMLILGELIKSAVLVFVGYLYARALLDASYGVQIVMGTLTAVICGIGVIWYKRHNRKSK